MKKLLTSALALALMTAGPALAKPHDDDNGGGKNRGQSAQNKGGGQDRGDRGNRGGDHENRGIASGNNPGQHRGWRNNPDNAAAQKYRGADNNNDRRGRNDNARNDRRNDNIRNDRRGDNFRNDTNRNGRFVDRDRDGRNDRFERRGNVNVNVRANGARRWNNLNDRRYLESRWNRRARNFDARAYRRAYVSPRRFRIGAYYRPAGWYYRRWSIGATLPFLFWSQNYWIDNWGAYGLAPAPWGYEWVRYGNDAILVDVRTGVILQVAYNIFW